MGAPWEDPLAQLAMCLFGLDWYRGLIWMSAIHFDESESGDRAVFVLAGCVSTVGQWVEFKKAWSERLARDGIAYFHTTDWATRRCAPYSGMRPAAHAALATDLYQLIEGANVLRCVIEIIPAKFYREVFVPMLHRDALRAYTDPYFFCFLSCLQQISLARQDGMLPDERVQCFFERRDEKRDRRLVREYERVRREFFPGQFGTIVGGTKGDPEVLPCQAADLIAYNTMRYIRRQKLGQSDDLPVIDLQTLSDKGELSGGSFSEPDVWKDFLETVRAHRAKLDRDRK